MKNTVCFSSEASTAGLVLGLEDCLKGQPQLSQVEGQRWLGKECLRNDEQFIDLELNHTEVMGREGLNF